MSDDSSQRLGFWYGLGAYGLWGLIPLYFKQVAHLPPVDIVAHRVVWSCALLAAIVVGLRRWPDAMKTLRSPGLMRMLAASTALIAVNWFTYIYAVSSGQVLEASLGYFITPLANVLLGVIVLGERLRRLQVAAILVALVAVVCLGAASGAMPWIAVSLACSFSCYGLVRKTTPVDPLLGLLVETALLLPLSGAYLIYNAAQTPTGQGHDVPTLALLALGGAITAAPLLLFAAAARRLAMTTLGFLQYLAPSLQFLVAVFVFGEAVSESKLWSFVGIWIAVAIYSADSLLAQPRRRLALGANDAAHQSPDDHEGHAQHGVDQAEVHNALATKPEVRGIVPSTPVVFDASQPGT